MIRVDSKAAGSSEDAWLIVSDVGAYGLVVTALGTPVALCDWEGLGGAALSVGVAGGITLIGKVSIDEERPDNSGNDSFPSGHTALSFSSATTLYRRYGWQAGIPAYTVATLTGSARVAGRKHYVWDVVAGAAIGIGSGWLFTEPINDKVRMVPWGNTKGGGAMVSVAW
ncbi:MAG: phosphatase PAP2 family protein [bacterium]|nr:phosphatase PAP2 family protein [Deltaproteobacteria bacterium]MCP4908108.1 phosphatase PAP2 family protein [bacterium]